MYFFVFISVCPLAEQNKKPKGYSAKCIWYIPAQQSLASDIPLNYILGSMQGMFGASVSELYLLVIEDSRSMCDHQKRNTHAYTGTVSQAWL